MFKKPWFWVIALIIITPFLFIFLSADLSFNLLNFRDKDVRTVETEDAEIEDKRVAVTVNDVDFNYGTIKSMMEQVEREILAGGGEVTAEEAKEIAISRAIKQAVLIDYARKEGFITSIDEIEEMFDEMLKVYNMEEYEFLEFVKNEFRISTRQEMEQLIEKEILIGKVFNVYINEVFVSEEEIVDIYKWYIEELKEEDIDESDLPTLEDMKEFIKNSIRHEKALAMLAQKAEELSADAAVNLFLDDLNF